MPSNFIPVLRALLPDGWFAKESITLLAPDGQGNVIASSEPLDPSIDTERYAWVQGDLLRREFPDFREISFHEEQIFGNRNGYIRHFSWTPASGVPVEQVQLYFVEQGRGFTATATSPAASFAGFVELFRAVLSSLEIDGPARSDRDEPDEPALSSSYLSITSERFQLRPPPVAAREAEAESPAGLLDIPFERPDVTLADVAGLDDVKRHLDTKVFAPLRNPALAQRFGRTPSGGLLMWGPPGCGKTYLARALAGSLSIPFSAIGMDEILDVWIGSSERNLASLFRSARSTAPCVLFFDETDAVGGRRSRMGASVHMRSVVSQMLVELDGATKDNTGVFTIGATNLPWDVDPALRRPGRFDRTLFVPPPDLTARVAILAGRLSTVPLGDDLNLAQIAARTGGRSAADLGLVADTAIDAAFTESMRVGHEVPVTQSMLVAAASQTGSSISDWIRVATTAAEVSDDRELFGPFIDWLARRDRDR